MQTSLQNHFLIAMPSLTDGFFAQSVVYICEHTEEGAMGLIINRPTQVMLPELLGHLNINNRSKIALSTPVLFGGPVEKVQGMVLHTQPGTWKSTMEIADNTFITTSVDILETIGTDQGPNDALVTLGYAGWDQGQLEDELAENSWLTVPANHDIIFNTPTEQRWHAAASLLGININLMSDTMGHA
jgi:putative transcriptional regulator